MLAGIPLFGKFADLGKKGGLLSRQILEAVGVVAVFEFIVNLQPFPLWIEIPLQLLLIFLAVLEAYTSISPEFAQVHRSRATRANQLGSFFMCWSS